MYVMSDKYNNTDKPKSAHFIALNNIFIYWQWIGEIYINNA